MDISYYKKFTKFENSNKDCISDMANSYSNQRDNAISPFSILINSNRAEDIKLNGVLMKAIINYRKIKEPMLNALVRDIQLPSNVMKYGDYVEYKSTSKPEDITNSNMYLIKSKIEFHDVYDSAYMQICNNVLKFKTIVDNKEELFEIPAIVGNGILSIEDNKYIDTLDNQLTCEVGISQIDKVKYIKDTGTVTRFLINGKAWKVHGIDGITKIINNQGVYIIKLASDEINPSTDNKELGIADYYKYTHTYTINILNIPVSDLSQTLSLTTTTPPIKLDIQITDEDNKILPNPILTYTSSNPNIISISNTGLITPIASGNCTIEVKFNDTIKIINIVIESLPIVDNLSISILGESTTYMNMDEIYNAKVMNNGVELTSKNVDWSISDLTFAKIVSKSGMICNLKMNMKNKFGVFKLKCWMIDDTSVFSEKEIRVSRM